MVASVRAGRSMNATLAQSSVRQTVKKNVQIIIET